MCIFALERFETETQIRRAQELWAACYVWKRLEVVSVGMQWALTIHTSRQQNPSAPSIPAQPPGAAIRPWITRPPCCPAFCACDLCRCLTVAWKSGWMSPHGHDAARSCGNCTFLGRCHPPKRSLELKFLWTSMKVKFVWSGSASIGKGP